MCNILILVVECYIRSEFMFIARVVRRLSGVMGLSAQDEADLHAIANFSHKTSKEVKPTIPEEFHFATDSRLRGPSAAAVEVAPVPVPPKPTHTGPTRPQEFHFATDARVKGKEPAQGEGQEYVDFTKSLRSSTTTLVSSSVLVVFSE